MGLGYSVPHVVSIMPHVVKTPFSPKKSNLSSSKTLIRITQGNGCYKSPPLKLDFFLEIIPYHPRRARQPEERNHNPEHTTAPPRQLNPTLAKLSKPDDELILNPLQNNHFYLTRNMKSIIGLTPRQTTHTKPLPDQFHFEFRTKQNTSNP